MTDHAVPTGDNIVSPKGDVLGSWDGKDVNQLKTEIARIKKSQMKASRDEKLTRFGIPHQNQFPDNMKNFQAYIIWGIDTSGNALVGSGANRTETVDHINEFYGNDIAMDAAARHDN